ncbi:phosphatase PAP2 family protein, partial [Acinetobacter baumannii]
AIYKFLKHKTTRPRPYQVHQVIVLGERPLDHFSFPSGHTLHAVMVTIVLGYIQPVLLAAMLPFMVLVALSRMVLGLHYPSDVIVGALIGAAVASLIIFVAPLLGIAL